MSDTCKSKKCGCEDKGLTTPTPCIHDTFECPNPDPCSETFSSCCVIYDKDTIVDTGINKGASMCDIIQILSLWATNPLCMDPNAVCKSVLSLFSTIISPTTITVGWAPNGVPASYQLEYKKAVDVSWLANPVLANTVFTDTIGGLLPNTAYHIRIKSTCTTNCYSVTILTTTKPTS